MNKPKLPARSDAESKAARLPIPVATKMLCSSAISLSSMGSEHVATLRREVHAALERAVLAMRRSE